MAQHNAHPLSARDQLLDMIEDADAFDHTEADLLPLRIEAANALFQQQRRQITVLDRRAQECGIDEIRSLENIVPLLFAHTVYKSYPASFVTGKKWDRMLQWLNTLCTRDPRGIDLTGVDTIDDFLDKLKANGHGILASTGTTGKNSFLDSTPEDRARKYRHLRVGMSWPGPIADKSRKVFWAGPAEGFNGSVEIAQMVGEMWARPGEFHPFKMGPILLSEATEMAVFSQRVADGEAGPDEIAAFNARAVDKAAKGRAAMAEFTEALLASRHEPVVMGGFWAQVMQMIERARELGIKDGDWHPDSRISVGGGLKNVVLPNDYKEQVDRFFGKVHRPNGYAMTELAQLLPRCEALRYHVPPGLIMLLLDDNGETLIHAKEGVVSGRFGFLDLIYEGRWGGLISGDRTEVDFSSHCPCGRRGPTILDTIQRFSQTGDDQISCAGTIDSYVKGALAS